ncbi:MAG TPA: DNA primase [Candidatus Azoamicus sp.]
MIQKTKIENIIKKFDILKLISSILEVKKHGSGFFTKCPFHNEKTASFYISKKSQRYYCFGCHKTGNIINFIMEYKKCSFFSAIEIISKEKMVTKSHLMYEKNYINDIENIFNYFNKILINNTKNNIYKFTKNRGLTEKSILAFKLGILTKNVEKIKEKKLRLFLEKIGILNKTNLYINAIFKDRLIIPIRNIKGEYIGIGGRTIYNTLKPKYINSPESDIFSKKKIFYGIYEAKNYSKNLIIVEGYFDVIKLHQVGITNVLAILGTAFSKEHLIILKSLCKNIIFCFDGDTPGKIASIKTAFMCLPFLFDFEIIKFVMIPNNLDPDSFITINGKNNFIKLLNKSISLIDFIMLSMNMKTLDFNFFFKINKILENVQNLFIKNFIIGYLSNYFYLGLTKISNSKCITSIFIKACIFLLKNRFLIHKIDFKKLIYNQCIFLNKDIRIFLDLCFLIKKNLNMRFSDLNKRLINKIKLKYINGIILINKMPTNMLENEFLSILKKIESYKNKIGVF